MLSILLDLIDDPSDKVFYEEIYNKYQKQMLFIAKEEINDTQLAEDATQDALIRVAVNIKALRNIKLEEKRRAYLLTAAKHAAIDIIKKRSKENTVNIDDFFSLQDDRAYDAIEQAGEMEYILKLMHQLPQKYIDALYMRFVADLSQKEAAQTLGIKSSTVGQHVKRGREMFIELYEKEKDK